MLKSRDTLPPGGWVFRQAETNWSSTFGRTFDETVDDIIKHRRANPRFSLNTDWQGVATELEVFTETRLRALPNASHYLVPGSPKPAPRNSPSSVKPVEPVAGDEPSIADGLPVLMDWLGDGLNPVSPELAQQRGAICATCPRNQTGDWKRWFTAPVAASIKMTIRMKHDMRLATVHDPKLNVCDACLCELKLKIWTPMHHIKSKLKDPQRQRLDPRCWILSE